MLILSFMETWLTIAEGEAPPEAVGGRMKMYTVYILESINTGRYYTGFTSDLNKRLKYHNGGKNLSTKKYIPWEVVYTESVKTKKEAWWRENQIKSYKGGVAFKKLIK